MTIIQGNFGRRVKKVDGDAKKKKPAPRYQFHVSLAFSEPLIWRRIQVPAQINLKQFHKVLQTCMGWSDEHSHQFYVGKIFYEMSSPSGEEKEYDEKKFSLLTLEEAIKWCFTYFYDANEGWEHDIVLEEIKQPQKGGNYPIVLDGEWASPPENIGGVHSYANFLNALQNPKEEKNSKILSDHDIGEFDPDSFDQEKINEDLKKGVWGVN